MSDVSKVSSKSAVSSTDMRAGKGAPAPQATSFDATKVAINQSINREAVVDSFTAAIKDAQDGGIDEATERQSTVGPEDKDRKTDAEVLDRVRKNRARTPQNASEPDNQDETKSRLEGQSKAVEATEEARTVRQGGTESKPEDPKRSHEQLMVISSTMDRNQTASHVAQTAARRVQEVLTSSLWSRDSTRSNRQSLLMLSKRQ